MITKTLFIIKKAFPVKKASFFMLEVIEMIRELHNKSSLVGGLLNFQDSCYRLIAIYKVDTSG